jgi:hypothetical protein
MGKKKKKKKCNKGSKNVSEEIRVSDYTELKYCTMLGGT